jgi:hypothetical protein
MKHYLLILLILPFASAALADPDLDPLVGEWSFVDDGCAEARMVFDLEGTYELRVAEDGRWKRLDGGRWAREDGLVVTETAGQRERFDVADESHERVVLVSRDDTVNGAATVGKLDLRRCPAY